MQNAPQKLLLAALLALPALAIAQPAATSASRGPQMAKHFEFTRPGQVKVDYLLYLPKGYEAKAGKRWPLMLFLHGAGERGTDLWKVAMHGPPKSRPRNRIFPSSSSRRSVPKARFGPRRCCSSCWTKSPRTTQWTRTGFI